MNFTMRFFFFSSSSFIKTWPCAPVGIIKEIIKKKRGRAHPFQLLILQDASMQSGRKEGTNHVLLRCVKSPTNFLSSCFSCCLRVLAGTLSSCNQILSLTLTLTQAPWREKQLFCNAAGKARTWRRARKKSLGWIRGKISWGWQPIRPGLRCPRQRHSGH